jgi:16S rRNA (cytosine967-C5)-methyltransferase
MTIPKRGATARPQAHESEISPARASAFRVLLRLEEGKSHSDDLLRGKAVKALSSADVHLATALVLGVLRWQIQLDAQLQVFLARPGARLDTEVRIALRLGALQILHMDRIPARAAIDESVEMTKQAGHHFAAKMVNAVLRKLAAAAREAFSEETVPALALAQAHPLWMVERWVALYGLDAAQAMCRYNQSQPHLCLRLADPKVELELAQEGITLERGHLLNAGRTVVSGDIAATAAFREGRVRIQDEGSQLVAEIASSLLANRNGSMLDACAAPGGKTLILAERNPQASIVACEISPQRLEAMRKRLAQNERIECRLADATHLPEDAAFDVVLVDAPCSGTGTLGRNPEIRHRVRLEDLPRQAERQRAILKAALRALRPGGFVVYSTCSLEPEENELVVSATLSEVSSGQIVPIHSILDAMALKAILAPNAAEQLQTALTPDGALRLIPGTFHCDGFFIAVLQRAELEVG